MRNIFILYMPPGNHEAMVHYEDTIVEKVSQDRIFKHTSRNLQNELRGIFGNKPIAIWGSRDGTQNRARFERMKKGDDVLIVEGDTIRLLGKIAAKTINEDLSRALWRDLKDTTPNEPWKLIYFIANPVEIDLPYKEINKLFGYEDSYTPRGFTSVAEEKLEDFYSEYDDLYSILLRIKDGEGIKKLPEEKVADENRIEEEIEKTDEEIEEKMDEKETTDHVRMQWKLLNLGLKVGTKVWIPKNDQTKIRKSYDFTDFEKEFTSGIDTPSKYVENIDVVWKEEFRIDAAFEVENSTQIYSGLLRFSDLKLVAPNSNYPLFIVAPKKRKSRVYAQVKRPSFKKISFDKKVRFLSYETVDEVDKFFRNSSGGLNTEILFAKSETLTR